MPGEIRSAPLTPPELFSSPMLIDRRTLLRSWKSLAGAVAALSAIPAALAFMRGGRKGPGAGQSADEWIDLGPAAEVGDAGWSARRFRRVVDDRWKRTTVDESVYVRRRGETIDAVSAICPHAGCLVHRISGGFDCPCHKSDFDEEGRPQSGPAPRPLDRLETRIEGNRLKLRFVRFRSGLDHPVPMIPS